MAPSEPGSKAEEECELGPTEGMVHCLWPMRNDLGMRTKQSLRAWKSRQGEREVAGWPRKREGDGKGKQHLLSLPSYSFETWGTGDCLVPKPFLMGFRNCTIPLPWPRHPFLFPLGSWLRWGHDTMENNMDIIATLVSPITATWKMIISIILFIYLFITGLIQVQYILHIFLVYAFMFNKYVQMNFIVHSCFFIWLYVFKSYIYHSNNSKDKWVQIPH